MKTNIYQKLHTAACEASGVVKGKKVPGMHFSPLLHDEVQKVAMEALLNNGLGDKVKKSVTFAEDNELKQINE